MTYERRRRGSADYSDTYYYMPIDDDTRDYSDTYYYDKEFPDFSNLAFYFGSGDSGYDNSGYDYLSSPDINSSVRLCGNVPFCEPRAFVSCKDIPIKSCKECSLVKGSFFLFLLIFLGISIFIGNLLIIAVGYLRYKKRKINKLDILKVSLAIADLLTGMLSN